VKKNPLYRECPVCNAGTSASTVDERGKQVPVAKLTCANPTCQHIYCFFHDNAHPGINCAEYARRQSRRGSMVCE
jgi:hypothetical protein